MLPTAPRRGCLSGSDLGAAGGAGRRVSSSAPGERRSGTLEGLPRARRPRTPLYAAWVARSVSASAKPRAQNCRSADFPREDVCHPSPTPARVLRGAFCTPASRAWRSVRLTLRVSRRTRRPTHWRVTQLRTILPTLRTILLNGISAPPAILESPDCLFSAVASAKAAR